MTFLRDMPLNTPWPGPEGGTLRTIPLSTKYGDAPFSLGSAPLNTLWPPTYTNPGQSIVDVYGSHRIAWGGTGFEGESHYDSLDIMGMGAWKFGPGNTYITTYAAANPRGRMVAYKTMWELGPAANTPSAIAAGQTSITYAEAQAWEAANPGDPWILRDAGGVPIVDSYGMHMGDISKPSLQARALSNLRYFLNTWSGLRIGIDGLWFDNLVPYMPVSNPKYGFDGVGGAAWNAAISWVQNVLGALKADGWYIAGNMLGDWTGESNNYSVTKQWHTTAGPYVNAPWSEGQSLRVNGSSAGAMRTGAGWVNITKGIQTNAQAAGVDFYHGMYVTNTPADQLQDLIYAKASWLVNWDGVIRNSTRNSVGGLDVLPVGQIDTFHAAWRTSTGLPTTPSQIGGEQLGTYIFRRQYQKAFAWVNADPTASWTIASSPDGRVYKDYSGAAVTFPISLGPGKGLILYTDTWIGGGSGGGGAAAGKTGGFTDDFADGVIGVQWTASHPGASTITESGSALVISVPLNTGVYASLALAASDLTGSAAYCSLDPNAAGISSGNQEIDFTIKRDSLNSYFFNITYASGVKLRAYKKVAGVSTQLGSIAYDNVNHRWLRIRESGGTIFFDTAPDSSGSPGTWVNRFSVVADWVPNNIQVVIDAGQDSGTTPAVSATVASFNVGESAALSYSAEILAESNLLHYFRFGESAGAGTAADSKTPGSVVLTARAGVTQGATGLITGDSDKAVSLNGGTGSYLDQTTGANFGPTSGSWAIEALINNTGPGTPTPNDYGTICGRDWTRRFLIQTGGTGAQKILAQFGGASLFSTNDLLQSARHHVVLEYDSVANLLKLYVDGALDTTATPTTTPTLAGAYAVGGYDMVDVSPDINYVFKGIIDELAVYSGVLGATKVASHYTNATT